MLNIGLAVVCAAIAWWLAFKRTVVLADPDPLGFSLWQVRIVLIGAGFIACLAVARYLTYRPGRGRRIGLANFMVLSAVLVAFFIAVFFVKNGGDLSDVAGMQGYLLKVLAVYWPA